MLRVGLVGLLIACAPARPNETPADGGTTTIDAPPDAPQYPGQLRPGFHLPGLAGSWEPPVSAELPRIAGTPDGVIVGGEYWQAGTVTSPAQWNGSNWVTLPPTDPYRVAVDASGTIYVVNRQLGCDLCGDVQIKRLVEGQWESLPGSFFAVQEMTATSRGLVIATFNSLHLFDGVNWVPLGTINGPLAEIDAVAESNGTLCVAGRFTSVDAVPASNVACQTTSGWTQAGDGLTGVVHALAFATDGRLIAGGTFTVAGGANVAVLGASTWTALGGGVAGTDPDVRAIKIDGDAIIVGGAFDTPVKNLGKFSQGTWSGPTGEWFAPATRPIVSDVAVKSDGVYIVGTFERIGDVAVSHIARWSTTIEPVMPAGEIPLGVNGRINALLRDTDGSIIAGGQFVAAGSLPALNVARFADGRWLPFGAILDQVTAFARTDTIYAGTKTGSVLRWTGTDWTSIGALNGTINAMLEYNGDLIVAGDFTTPDRIARWTGSQFEPIGSGLPWRALALGNIRGTLCAGLFVPDNLSDPEDRPLRCWDGMYWRPEPLAGWDVRSIAVLADNSVAVAGSFKVAPADYVSLAINRGTTWEPIRVRSNVQIVLPYADGMFLGGWPWVRWWDGHSSEPFPELLFGSVQALALLPQGLLVGGAGQFSRVNAAPFSYGAAAFDF